MASITISDADLKKADAFLSAYLADKVPDADFSPGSAMRDLVIKAVAYIFAFLEKERQTIRDHSSLLALSKLPPSTDVDAAVDAFLSNLFLTRKTGKESRVQALLHFSQPTDVIVTPATRFFRTATLVFVPDIAQTTVIPASDLVQATNTDGTSDWTASIPLVAAGKATSYNVQPGRFISTDRFNPFFTFAENISAGVDGRGPETTAELMARAPTALSTRNLINDRSVAAVLFDKYPTLTRALTVGMGDPEMRRDLATELAPRLRIHLGGCTDIFLGLPRAETVAAGLVVGAGFVRADGLVRVLQDAAGFSGVEVGQVLNITAGIPAVPRQTLITRVAADEIEFATSMPLTGAVDYSIGRFGPAYTDVVPRRTTGVLSNEMTTPDSVYLPAGPVYRIRKVELVNGGSVTEIPTRVNGAPATVDEYQVEVLNPEAAQSARAITRLRVHPSLTGQSLNVTYDQLVGYSAVQEYVTGRFDRVINANHLTRGYHPVYVSAQVAYQMSVNAKTKYDNTTLATSLTEYINNYDWTNTLDCSDLVTYLKNTFPDIGTVYPIQLTYELLAPDGQVYKYGTTDVASVFPDGQNLALLANGAAVVPPIAQGDNTTLATRLKDLGVSDRTVRYFADFSDIILWERDVDDAPANYAPVVPGSITIVNPPAVTEGVEHTLVAQLYGLPEIWYLPDRDGGWFQLEVTMHRNGVLDDGVTGLQGQLMFLDGVTDNGESSTVTYMTDNTAYAVGGVLFFGGVVVRDGVPGRTYDLVVIADGYDVLHVPFFYGPKPAQAPTGVNVGVASDTINVSWAPNANIGGEVNGAGVYVVVQDIVVQENYFFSDQPIPIGETTASFPGLSSGTYDVTVFTYNSAGSSDGVITRVVVA